MKVSTDQAKIKELLTRGVEKIYPSAEALERVLRSGQRLKLYQGFDPTGDKLHLGHLIGLRKLAAWQNLGHEVIFLIGDGTGQAGDPSGKTQSREKFHTTEELRANAKNYVAQTRKILRFRGENKVKVLYNSAWLNKLTLLDILNIAQNFSLTQLSERDLFKARLKKGETVNMREFLYPLLQAYDSVVLDIDLEVGGTDQTFNMLCGRTLSRSMKNKEKFVMTLPILVDKTGRKIGKSEGNLIALDDEPSDLFGKVMALPDEVIVRGLEWLSMAPQSKVKAVERAIAAGKNPMVYKKELAYEIVKDLYGPRSAKAAGEKFAKIFQHREIPEAMIELRSGARLSDVLVSGKVVASKTEFRRLSAEGAIFDLDRNKKITDANFAARPGMRLRVGKRRFVKIK